MNNCNTLLYKYLIKNEDIIDDIVLTEEHQRLSDECDKLFKQLKETLNEKQAKALNNIINNLYLIELELINSYLIGGLKIGIRLCAESFVE